jgi:hypothetical protein
MRHRVILEGVHVLQVVKFKIVVQDIVTVIHVYAVDVVKDQM